jgi:hypothetical protein
MRPLEPASNRRKRDIVEQALKRQTPAERAAFLDGACGDDAVLRAEMQSMLAGKKENQETVPLNAGVAGLQIEEGTAELRSTLLDETPLSEGTGHGDWPLQIVGADR